MQLRPWQIKATKAYNTHAGKNFLTVACPGAGKTTFSLSIAADLLCTAKIGRVIVVVPTDSLRTQWAGNGLVKLSPELPADGIDSPGFDGLVTTYASLTTSTGDRIRKAIGPTDSRRTLVIMDEVHHAEMGSSYGKGLLNAFEHASRRLLMSGTPWRTDDREAMPFVEFDDTGLMVADYTYDYAQALKDKACRPIQFAAVKTHAAWNSKQGACATDLSVDRPMQRKDRGKALRSVLDPTGDWMKGAIREAHEHLTLQRATIPDAGGLIVCRDMKHAMQVRSTLAEVTGVEAPVAVSGDVGLGKGSDVIDSFRKSKDPWIIAVNMIAEGVDIPRLTTGIYATNKFTTMFFTQVVGRFVRIRPDEDVTARLYIPSLADVWECALSIDQTELQVLRQKSVARGKRPPAGGGGKQFGFAPSSGAEIEDIATVSATSRLEREQMSKSQQDFARIFASVKN